MGGRMTQPGSGFQRGRLAGPDGSAPACGLPAAELSQLQWEGDHASIHEIALFEHATQREA